MSLSDRENTDLSISDEDIEFLQNSPYKLTIPLEELISPAGINLKKINHLKFQDRKIGGFYFVEIMKQVNEKILRRRKL